MKEEGIFHGRGWWYSAQARGSNQLLSENTLKMPAMKKLLIYSRAKGEEGIMPLHCKYLLLRKKGGPLQTESSKHHGGMAEATPHTLESTSSGDTALEDK